jgi:hypothetical protein
VVSGITGPLKSTISIRDMVLRLCDRIPDGLEKPQYLIFRLKTQAPSTDRANPVVDENWLVDPRRLLKRTLTDIVH